MYHVFVVVCSLQDQREKQKHHEKMYKPASKHQLEEVWEDDDGLKDEQFDPKTFFFLHGQCCTHGGSVHHIQQCLFFNVCVCVVKTSSYYFSARPDTNGDKILDPMELQALFYSEVSLYLGQ